MLLRRMHSLLYVSRAPSSPDLVFPLGVLPMPALLLCSGVVRLFGSGASVMRQMRMALGSASTLQGRRPGEIKPPVGRRTDAGSRPQGFPLSPLAVLFHTLIEKSNKQVAVLVFWRTNVLRWYSRSAEGSGCTRWLGPAVLGPVCVQ